MSPVQIRRLIGIYDADGTVRGELAYFVGARLGRAHCALCDITHGRVRERPEWKDRRAALPVAFELFHRDDQPPEVREAAGIDAPYVVADTGSDLVVLLDGPALEACHGAIDALVMALDRAVLQHDLMWPDGSPSADR
jgi:hypothetical protein